MRNHHQHHHDHHCRLNHRRWHQQYNNAINHRTSTPHIDLSTKLNRKDKKTKNGKTSLHTLS